MAFETPPGQKQHRTSAARQHGRRGAIVWVGSWRTNPAYRCGSLRHCLVRASARQLAVLAVLVLGTLARLSAHRVVTRRLAQRAHPGNNYRTQDLPLHHLCKNAGIVGCRPLLHRITRMMAMTK